MEIYVLIKAVQNGNSLDLKCAGAYPSASKAREAMRKDYDATRNATDFDRDAPDATSDSAFIIADDDTLTLWRIEHATLAVVPEDAEVSEVPL